VLYRKGKVRPVLKITAAIAAFSFLLSCGEEKTSETGSPVTFAQVFPIFKDNCTVCHHTGGAGPFPLTNYAQIKRKATTIVKVTGSHFMPPWPADVNYRHFAGEKHLSDSQIGLIKRWVDGGCTVGDTTSLGTIPDYASGLSIYGKPDKVVKMKAPFILRGDNKDAFYLMKFPYELPQDTFIRFIEFVPDKKKIVHHVNGFLIQYETDKKKDVYEGDWFADTQAEDYKTAYEKMKLSNDDGRTFPTLTSSAVNYLPGVQPAVYPDGIGGFRVKKKGAIFLKDIHYGPTPKDTVDDSYFNIFYMKEAPKRPLLELQMGTLGVSPIVPPLVIPPDSVKTFSTEIRLNKDISIVTVNPHMHLLGKTFWAFAIPPSGDTIPLIKIRKWDFRWQYFYTYPKMLKLPAGTLIKVIGVYDNTKNNPLNPFSPPRTVAEREGSMRTSDEMFQFIINYLPYQPGDEQINLEK
jgi:hypothetical protein